MSYSGDFSPTSQATSREEQLIRSVEVLSSQYFAGIRTNGIFDSKAPKVKELRHKWELPMLILGVILTVIIFIGAVTVIATGNDLKNWAAGVLAGVFSPLVAIFFVQWLYWKTISNGIQITEKQLPEIYEIYASVGGTMGFGQPGQKPLPRLYLINGNGTMNAFASKCKINAHYVVLHSDILDLAYQHGQFGALRYIITHELGHIKCGHVDLWRVAISPILAALLLSKTLTRAQEYTADRVANYYSGAYAKGMIGLYAGKHFAHQIDIPEDYHTLKNHGEPLFLRLVNFRSDHAVGFRRMLAIENVAATNWDIHGKML